MSTRHRAPLDNGKKTVANTRKIADRTERKAKKRSLRTALKAQFTKMTKDLKRRFRNGETKGLRKFLSEQKTA